MVVRWPPSPACGRRRAASAIRTRFLIGSSAFALLDSILRMARSSRCSTLVYKQFRAHRHLLANIPEPRWAERRRARQHFILRSPRHDDRMPQRHKLPFSDCIECTRLNQRATRRRAADRHSTARRPFVRLYAFSAAQARRLASRLLSEGASSKTNDRRRALHIFRASSFSRVCLFSASTGKLLT